VKVGKLLALRLLEWPISAFQCAAITRSQGVVGPGRSVNTDADNRPNNNVRRDPQVAVFGLRTEQQPRRRGGPLPAPPSQLRQSLRREHPAQEVAEAGCQVRTAAACPLRKRRQPDSETLLGIGGPWRGS